MANILAHGVTALQQLQVARYAEVSGAAWLVYELFLTFPLEVKHIWQREWSLPKVMFIVSRYYALFHVWFYFAVSTSVDVPLPMYARLRNNMTSRSNTQGYSCAASERIAAYGVQVLSYITDGLLVMRLHSVFGRKWKITGVLLALYIVQAVIEAVVVGLSTTRAVPVVPPQLIPAIQGCAYSEVPRYILIAWGPSLLFATILFAMTLYKLYQLRLDGIKIDGIVTVFVRDGAMFFAMIFAAELVSTITAAIAPAPLLQVAENHVVAVLSIATTRLILNLREYGNVAFQGTTTLLSIGGRRGGNGTSDMQFRRPGSTAVMAHSHLDRDVPGEENV